MASSLEGSELYPSPLFLGHSDLLQLLDVVLNPVITGVGTNGTALFGDEAMEQERERLYPRVQHPGSKTLSTLPNKFLI